MGYTIFDMVNAKEVTMYWDTLARQRPPYMLESKFPAISQLGSDVSWLKGKSGIPKVLKMSAFDVQAIPRQRIGFERMQTEMPFFKESMYIDEKLRQELNRVLETGNRSYIDAVLNRVFNDTTTLLEAASVARERMRASLITTGAITLESNGQIYSVDYGLDAAQKPTVAKAWSDPETSIIDDVREWQDLIEENTGVRPTEAICTRKTWNYFVRNKEIRNAILGNDTAVAVPESAVKSYIMSTLDLSVTVYSKRYVDEEGNTHPFIADDTFILIPPGKLGNMVFGTTPEQADLMGSNAIDNVSITDTGVAVTTMRKADPVNVETKVTMLCMPTFEAADQIIIADLTTA